MQQWPHKPVLSVVIAADIMFVNPFPCCLFSQDSVWCSWSHPSRKQDFLFTGLKSVIQIYSQRGLKVTHALMDNKFEAVRWELAGGQVQLDHEEDRIGREMDDGWRGSIWTATT
jgi:hypothetical protein